MVIKKLLLFALAITMSYGSTFFLSQKFEKAAFYNVMASGTLNDVETELAAVESAPANERNAYEGILLMRKAGLVGKPKDKLHFFKIGRIKFQTAFMADSNNAEYRFLRLGIQEHAPKIVKYHGNIITDRAYIREHFKSLSPVVQHAVLAYSKTSKVIHPEDFTL